MKGGPGPILFRDEQYRNEINEVVEGLAKMKVGSEDGLIPMI